MPYSADAPPPQIEALPKAAQAIWIAAFNSAFRAYEGTDAEKVAFAVAWDAVKKKYEQKSDGKWVEKLGVGKRAFIAGERIVVEMNQGLDGEYSSLSYKPIDAGLGVFMNEGSTSDGTREAAALYFLMSSGWDVARAVKWARDWASGRGGVVKRVGIEGNDKLLSSTHFAPINHARLTKAVADPALASKRIAFAEVLVPWTVDTQGDIATDDEVENAAHRFMENPMVGIMHEEWGDIGTVVENFISRDGDTDFEMPGTWVMGIKFNEFAWHKILNNELTGLSIGGTAEQEEILSVEGA